MKTVIRPTAYKARWSLLLLGCALCGSAAATQITYYPVNPTFGGNPLNGSVLLNNAEAQNKYDDNPDMSSGNSGGFTAPTALQDFNETLQRSILARLSAAATTSLIDSSGKLIPGSTITTADFVISISNPDNSGVLTVTTTDKATGAVTSFQVQQ